MWQADIPALVKNALVFPTHYRILLTMCKKFSKPPAAAAVITEIDKQINVM
jgi:hypothetical protein